MFEGRARPALAAACVTVASLSLGLTAISTGRGREHHACASPSVSAPRDRANPLALPNGGGSVDPLRRQDPLHGAHFFVDGPKHAPAAGALAQAPRFNA